MNHLLILIVTYAYLETPRLIGKSCCFHFIYIHSLLNFTDLVYFSKYGGYTAGLFVLT